MLFLENTDNLLYLFVKLIAYNSKSRQEISDISSSIDYKRESLKTTICSMMFQVSLVTNYSATHKRRKNIFLSALYIHLKLP